MTLALPKARVYGGSEGGGGSSAIVSGVLTTDGPIFRMNGQPWRWKGVSAFGLANKFRNGDSIDGFLSDYAGFNLLRVWDYVPWTENGWDAIIPAIWLDFCAYVGQHGFAVEITLLTDDDPARIEPAKHLVRAVSQARPSTLVVWEAGNEPQSHKNINTPALRDVLDGSGMPYASGDYEQSARAFGWWLNYHSARTTDWVRRAHDAYEYFFGGGPNSRSDPAHKCPCVGDEPAKLQDVAPIVKDWRAYFGACSILGAGATFHSQTGLLGDRPTPDEQRLAAAALEGLNAFPEDAAVELGTYRRVVEPGNQPGGPTENSRTYVVGSAMVRCQQTRAWDDFEPGWRSLDADGVLWTR